MGERMAQEALRVKALPETVLPVQNNLFAWYRGDHGVMPVASTSATVTRWDDLTTGATNRDLTQIVGTPQIIGGGFLGVTQRNFVRFDGTSQSVWSSSATFGFATNARALFFAARVNAGGDGFLFDGSTATGMSRAQVRTNFWQVGLQPSPIGNAPNADTGTAPRALGVWQFHEFDYVPTNGATLVRHWINGTNAAVFTNANVNGLGGFILAANAQAQKFLGVDIAEVLVYTNDLSASNRAAVLSYLQSNWTPTVNPPDPSGVYAWFTGDSSLGVGTDFYSATVWTNLGSAATNSAYSQSGRNLINLTGSPQKIFLRSPGGAALGAVNFGGSDGIWATKAAFGMLTNNYSVIACVLVSNAVPQGFLFDSTSFTPGLTRALVWSNNWQVSAANNAGTITAPVTTNVWQIHSFVIGTNTGAPAIQHFINGVQVGSVAINAPDYLSGLMIGASVSQANGIQASVAEFLVFNRALDDAARTNVENYLAAKWSGVVPDPNAPAPSPYTNYTPVFVSGTGYAEYRIPAMVTTTNGTVIAVADGRTSNGDIPNPLDCVCRRSFDNGNTWAPLQVIAAYSTDGGTDTYPAYGITNPIMHKCAGDSSLLLDRTNGRVWILYDNGTASTNRFNSTTRAIKLEMRYSDDNGATWSPRVDVEALNTNLRPTITAAPEFLTGPGNGIQLSAGTNAGRLIFPVYIYGSPYYSSLIYSDDHGATWKLGGNCGTGGGEIQIVETPGGELLASMRDNAFSWSGVRTFSRSPDGGLTWDALFTNLSNPPMIPDPACQGSILRLTITNDNPANPASRIVFANCNSSASRVAMTLRISYDEGQTWSVSNLVYSGISGYSSLTKLANGEVGLLNEVNNFARIDFVARTVNTISGGTDTNLLGSSNLLNWNFFPASGTNAPSLGFSAQSNNTYTIQFRTNLASGGWQRFLDVAAQPTNLTVQLPANTTNTAQFFRLVTPQLP
jgi:sialidase-1